MEFFQKHKRVLIFGGIFLLLLVVATILLWPTVKQLDDPNFRKEMENWIAGLGFWGYLVILGIQMIQIVIAFIPGEFVEVLAGVMYGGFTGLLLCLLGCVLASSFIFFISEHFFGDFFMRQFKQNDLDRFSFLKDEKKVETIIFILFLIPGTPKDMLTYLAPASNISLINFILLSTFARIPSIATSTYMGENIGKGDWQATLVIFLVTALIGFLGIRYKDDIIKRLRKHRESK